MKLLRVGPLGQEVPAIEDQDGVWRDVSAHVSDWQGDALGDDALAKLAALDLSALPALDANSRIGACVGHVGKFICIGLNYADHAEESGMEVPAEPVIFFKATSAVCGPDDDILIPRGSEKTDWEVELCMVIGKAGKYIDEADAMDHVAGYCVGNDLSERAFQLEGTGEWEKGKGCDHFGPIGPYLITKDEIADFNNLGMWLEVNGERVQDGNTKTMIFKLPHLVSYVSKFMSLQPGDVISTGTPPGVGLGMNPPRYLKAGDKVQLGIDGMGTQTQTCVQD